MGAFAAAGPDICGWRRHECVYEDVAVGVFWQTCGQFWDEGRGFDEGLKFGDVLSDYFMIQGQAADG